MAAKISPSNVQSAYLLLVDVLEKSNLNKAEVICALVVILGTQYKGSILNVEEMKDFTIRISQWLQEYFNVSLNSLGNDA